MEAGRKMVKNGEKEKTQERSFTERERERKRSVAKWTLTKDVEGGRGAGDGGEGVGDAALVRSLGLATHPLQHQVPPLSQHAAAPVRVKRLSLHAQWRGWRRRWIET